MKRNTDGKIKWGDSVGSRSVSSLLLFAVIATIKGAFSRHAIFIEVSIHSLFQHRGRLQDINHIRRLPHCPLIQKA